MERPGGRPEDPTYSNPVVAVINGQRLIIAGNADGNLYAIKARTGEKVWSFAASQRGLNSSPVVDGYRVYITHSEENFDSTAMGRVACIDGRGQGDVTKTHELWRCDGIDAGYASPLLHDGRLYVMSNSGVLHCFDALTGKQHWQFVAGRIGKGSPVWADGKIYLTTANGTFVILEDKGDSCEKIDSLDFNTGGEGGIEIFSSPAISDGRIAFFTTTEMICFGKDAKPQAVAAETLPEEAAPEKEPAALLIRPAEVLLRPGESAKFQVIAYDRHGRRIGPADVACTFPLKLGTVDAEGRFIAGKRGGIGEVRAELGKLVGAARVRVVPALPISEDFESFKDGETIGWWVGVSKLKYTIDTRDGSKVLKKLHDDNGPIFNRSLAYITPPMPGGLHRRGRRDGRERGPPPRRRGPYELPLRDGTLRRWEEAASLFLDPRAAVREEDRLPLGRGHVVPHEAQGRGRRPAGQDPGQGLAPQRARTQGVDDRGQRSAAQRGRRRRDLCQQHHGAIVSGQHQGLSMRYVCHG